jgi:hypothetical protein
LFALASTAAATRPTSTPASDEEAGFGAALGQAHADPDLLWRPNHRLVKVTIGGLIDPGGNPVTITVTKVTQDEPVDSHGKGDLSPDAVLRDGELFLRAERDGNGNGRVYRVHFTASVGGLPVPGAVNVTVPHAIGGAAAVDDGQNYDSFDE